MAVSEMKMTMELAAFKAACKTLKERKYESAANQFGAILETLVEEHGDFGAAVAPVYYEYGNALLMEVESNSNVFGESVKSDSKKEQLDVSLTTATEQNKTEEVDSAAVNQPVDLGELSVSDILDELIVEYKKKNGEEPTDEVLQQWKETLSGAPVAAANEQADTNEQTDTTIKEVNAAETKKEESENVTPAGEASEAQSKEDPSSSSTQEGAAVPMANEDLEETMNIAWEVLETGRVALTQILDTCKEEGDLAFTRNLLAKTYLRLADLSMERGHFENSIKDYEASLEKHLQVFPANAMELVDVYTHLATSHVFASSTVAGVTEMRDHQLKALRWYVRAITGLVSNRAELMGKTVSVDIELLPSDEEIAKCGKALKHGHNKEEEEDDDNEAKESAKKGKGKARILSSKTSSSNTTEDPPVSPQEQAQLEKAKEALNQVTNGLPSSDKEADGAPKERLIMIEMLREKVDDILLVLENKEAANAISGASAGVVEEGLSSAAADESNPFDAPTLSDPNEPNVIGESGGPTNLLQARKKATTASPTASGPNSNNTSALQSEDSTTKRKEASPSSSNATPTLLPTKRVKS